MSLEAMDLAYKMMDINFNATSELYGINVYRLDQTSNRHTFSIPPEVPFMKWISNEVSFTDNFESIGKLCQQ